MVRTKKGLKSRGVIGIDPGLSGAFVFFNGTQLVYKLMPVADKRVDFDKVWDIVDEMPNAPIFLERAMPMAMGAKHAFNYGADFCKIEIAIQLTEKSYTLVEPAKWTKDIFQGVSKDLKPKAKSLVALKRLYPKLVSQIPTTPKSKKMHEGVVDALLIAAYGMRTLKMS